MGEECGEQKTQAILDSRESACSALHERIERMFPDASACIYLANSSGTHFTAPKVCDCQRGSVPHFRHYECWALCKEKAHIAGNSEHPHCSHVQPDDAIADGYLCLPIRKNNRILGLLHVRQRRGIQHHSAARPSFIQHDGLQTLGKLVDDFAVSILGLEGA